MKKHIGAISAIGVLIFVAAACSGSFTTANISELKFGNNQKADPSATSFKTGEDIYAVAAVSNASGKNKLNFKITYENVQGKGKGEVVGQKSTDVEGSMILWQQFSSPLPGEYKVVATLSDESGKQIGERFGTVTITGTAPAAAPPTSDKKKSDDDEDN